MSSPVDFSAPLDPFTVRRLAKAEAMRQLRMVRPTQDAELECPFCQGQNLHQRGVVVLRRSAEDGDGERVTVDTTKAGGQATRKAIPAIEFGEWRRDIIEIHFWCEHCPKKPVMRVVQHKGTTLLRWVMP